VEAWSTGLDLIQSIDPAHSRLSIDIISVACHKVTGSRSHCVSLYYCSRSVNTRGVHWLLMHTRNSIQSKSHNDHTHTHTYIHGQITAGQKVNNGWCCNSSVNWSQAAQNWISIGHIFNLTAIALLYACPCLNILFPCTGLEWTIMNYTVLWKWQRQKKIRV